MSQHRRTRLSVALAAFAVVAAALVPAFPAAADDAPPTPEVTASAEPTSEPTPDPTSEPSADPTAGPTPEPTADPTEAPAASADTAEFTGEFVDLSDEGYDRGLPDGVRTFHATGEGYLLIAAAPNGTATVHITVQVPEGIDADDTQALIDASVTHPLTLLDTQIAAPTAQMINQFPNTSAVHKIYAVLVTPNNAGGGAASNQTAAEAATLVQSVNDFWSQQSSGSVSFSLAGTVPWYNSANVCTTDPGSTALWNEAAVKAAAQIGYADKPNNHLVLIFPAAANCGGPIGLGTIGAAANVGGRLWTIGGGNIEIRTATLAHELGHNLSLGHADFLRCSSTTGTSGCLVKNYGDLTDVMGYGQDLITPGALSSAQAIRAGLWPTGSYAFAPKGTKSYVLKPVSGNSGLRSVVVEDNSGETYFVEFRNYTGEDDRPGNVGTTLPGEGAQCSASWCVTDRPGVRILRMEQGTVLKGASGDDSYLIGRTIAGADRIDYLKNESYSINGITIKVTALSASSATVSVVRNFTAGSLGTVYTYAAVNYDSTKRVGDTYGLVLDEYFTADSEKFQWYRSGTAISGATKQFYTFANADLGKTITVKLTVSSKGYTSSSGTFSLGLIAAAAPAIGTVSVSAPGTFPLKATPTGFPWGSTFKYQWFRDTMALSGATAATYTPVAADANHQVKVSVTTTSAGNSIPVVSSPGYDYRLDTDAGPFGITGTQKAGNVLTAPTLGYHSTTPASVAVTRAYVWYRKTGTAAPVVISGQTGATYTLTGTDTGKTISVRVAASAPGYLSNVTTTSPTGVIAAGKIQGSLVGPGLTKTGTTTTTVKLAAALPSGSVTETGVAYKYQWYRSVPAGTPELPISGATASSYLLTKSDYNKLVWVTITVTKTGYGTEVLGSSRLNYSVTASDTPAITGTAAVGEFLSANFLTYGVTGPDVPPTYTWYADGVVVQTGDDNYYQVKAADYKKPITVRVTAARSGYLSLVLTSPATAAVVKGSFAGTLNVSVLENGRVLTASPSGVVPAPVYVYQWLRNNVAITGATKVSYTLATADYGKSISVKVTATKPNFTSVPATSTSTVYSVLTSGVPAISGELRVGAPLTVALPTYTVFGGNTTPSPIGYQWYRSGVAISAASGGAVATYTPVAADLGKTLTVKVTAGYISGNFNLLPSVLTTAATQKVGNLTLGGWNAQGGAVVNHAGLVLTVPAAPAGTGITESGTTVTYLWYRNGAAISGATKVSYTLTSADASKLISVRVITSKANFTTIVKYSTPVNYTVVQNTPASIDLQGGGAHVGTTIAASTGAYTAGGSSAAVTFKYTWYRNGVAITGIPVDQGTYTLVTADKGKKITVRVIASAGTEWLPLSFTTAPTPVVLP